MPGASRERYELKPRITHRMHKSDTPFAQDLPTTCGDAFSSISVVK